MEGGSNTMSLSLVESVVCAKCMYVACVRQKAAELKSSLFCREIIKTLGFSCILLFCLLINLTGRGFIA